MYITDKYWGELIGGDDDSLVLADYLAEKQKEEISLGEIFSDFGLDQLNGDFQQPEIPLVYTDAEGWEMEIHYAVSLMIDLAALLLECRVTGSVDMEEIVAGENKGPERVRITATAEEHALINQTLRAFAADPLSYDLSEMTPEEDMGDLAALCEALRQELYE